jgi:hypothetical protein
MSQTPAYVLDAYVSIEDDDITAETRTEKYISMEITRKETNEPEEEEKKDHDEDI